MKKGQITVFIIIGLILLVIIGTALYMYRARVTREIEVVRPKVAELPTEIQPLRDLVEQCVQRLATDGLRRIGDRGGYIDPTFLSYNPSLPTEGEAVQLAPNTGPNVAYWWHMKSPNKCTKDCIFDSERPGLYKSEGGLSIETQLAKYVADNLRGCLGNFEDFTKRGCNVQELGEPEITANIADADVFFVGKFPLRAVCEDQSFEVSDSYVTIPLNLREIYNLATELTNFESEQRILEQTTKTLISTFSEIDRDKLPPVRGFQVGPPKPGVFWIKYEVLQKLKDILVSYIPLIQASGQRNFNYIAAPPDVRDPELYELMYNRQFFLPLNGTHPTLEVRFVYLDWWEPYFDLNCNGQLCEADSASNFAFIPFSMNRYNFAYDLSYPVMVEIRNPFAFNGEGYSFKFFMEQNLRDSDAFEATTVPLKAVEIPKVPSNFCAPAQQTSGEVSLYVKDGVNLRGMDEATVSFLCGGNNCNLGETEEGNFSSKFPRCLGGTLRITKQGYASYSAPLDTNREEPLKVDVLLEPVRTLNVTIKNYPIVKASKWSPWEFTEAMGLLRPRSNQTTTITLIRSGSPYEEPFTAVAELYGDDPGQLTIVPGDFQVRIMSFLKEENLTIPPDYRCTKYKKGLKTKKECYFVPEDPIEFNETSPFPYGGAEYEYELSTNMLRGARNMEFRQFILAIDRVAEPNRIIEDLNEISKVNLYATANVERIYPVIS